MNTRRSISGADRLAAILEVLLAFALVHLAYRSLKHFTALGQQETAAGLNFSPGLVMILATVGMLLVTRRNFEQYGLTLNAWSYNLNLGLLWSILIVLAVGIVIKVGLFHFDPLHPPDLTRALVFSSGQIIITLLLILFLKRDRPLLHRIPPMISILILIALLSLPIVPAMVFHRDVPNVCLRILWLFFCAGFGEEIFFRGYIQSRVTQSFGRPWRFLGLQFGAGLIVSSLLFGFIHALNTVDYFHGRFDFAWLWCLTNFTTGLFFGCLREKTGSILPAAIIHGLADVLAEVPGLLG
jgi:membrane protease YdiL (CAAX protease family)